MRITVNVEKTDSPTCKALTNFLDFHLIEKNHSITFQGIFFEFIENPKKTKNLSVKWSMENGLIYLCQLNSMIQAKYTYDFNEELLLNDFNLIELPTKDEELVKWYDEKGT